jgi:hypothetical protein
MKGLIADARMKENARKTAEKYSVQARTERLIEVYEGVLGEIDR